LIKPTKYTTLKLEGHVLGTSIMTLVDNGGSNNFIDESFVLRENLERVETQESGVTNARGYQTICKWMIRDLILTIGNYTILDDFYVYPMGGSPHIVLRVQQLYQLGDATFNYGKLEMSFFEQGRRVTLKCINTPHSWTAIHGLEITPISHGHNNSSKLSLRRVKGQLLTTMNSPGPHATWKSKIVGLCDSLLNIFLSPWYMISFGCIGMRNIAKRLLQTTIYRDISAPTSYDSICIIEEGRKSCLTAKDSQVTNSDFYKS